MRSSSQPSAFTFSDYHQVPTGSAPSMVAIICRAFVLIFYHLRILPFFNGFLQTQLGVSFQTGYSLVRELSLEPADTSRTVSAKCFRAQTRVLLSKYSPVSAVGKIWPPFLDYLLLQNPHVGVLFVLLHVRSSLSVFSVVA